MSREILTFLKIFGSHKLKFYFVLITDASGAGGRFIRQSLARTC